MLLYKQHHLDIYSDLCLVQSMHCCKQLHLQNMMKNCMSFLTPVVFCMCLQLTRTRVSKLSAGHIGINCFPIIITHSSPLFIHAYFHSSVHTGRTISKSDAAMSTPNNCKENSIRCMIHTLIIVPLAYFFLLKIG